MPRSKANREANTIRPNQARCYVEDSMMTDIENWAEDNDISLSDSIRRLVSLGLKYDAVRARRMLRVEKEMERRASERSLDRAIDEAVAKMVAERVAAFDADVAPGIAAVSRALGVGPDVDAYVADEARVNRIGQINASFADAAADKASA